MAVSQGRLEREQARQFWMHTPEVALLDTGRVTPEEFARLMDERLQLGLGTAAMLQALDDWLQGPYPGVRELLQQLGARYRLAVLSNNNALHWGKIERQFDILPLFETCFASHHMGLRKPDLAVYQPCAASLASSCRHHFFDDNIECVHSARQAGWQACHTVGFDAVRQAVQAHGLLD
jgi:putative hydrolase of the HAD superfamily